MRHQTKEEIVADLTDLQIWVSDLVNLTYSAESIGDKVKRLKRIRKNIARDFEVKEAK